MQGMAVNGTALITRQGPVEGGAHSRAKSKMGRKLVWAVAAGDSIQMSRLLACIEEYLI